MSRMNARTLGEWLAAGLADTTMTQKDLAERAGLSPQYINDVVRGRRIPPRRTIVRICKALGLPSAGYPSALAGYLPPGMDGIRHDDLLALLAVLEVRRQIWPDPPLREVAP